jgi:hypothetical protein
MSQQSAYIPFDSLEQAKQDAKLFYALLEKHFAIKKSSISYKYDIYAKYFGYKGFSDATNKAKLFSDKEYLPPCFMSAMANEDETESQFKYTLNFISKIIEDNKTELTPNESIIGLHKGGFYESLQKKIAVSSRDEFIEANIKEFGFKSNCKSKSNEKYYYFTYTHPDTLSNINVKLTKESMQNFHDEILRTREYNKEKDILEDTGCFNDDYVRCAKTHVSLPLYRTPEYGNIKVHTKAVIGCLHNKADYMMTYMLKGKEDDNYDNLFFDLFFNESQIDEMLFKMQNHLK